MIDYISLGYRRDLERRTLACLISARAAGVDEGTVKRALMALGPSQARLLLPEEVEGLMQQLNLAEA